MIIKRAKTSRARGTKTHGWGHKKKHRGSGSRGGKGNAGSGKRGDSKKPSFWKDLKYMGRHGFTSLNKKPKSITLRDVDKKYEAGKINLTEAGFDKILGTGKLTKKFEIIICSFSKRAEEKIKEKGGKISTGLDKPAKESSKKEEKQETKK